MPARVIRGEINSSRSLSRVSPEADLTFRALLVAVDDYGRIDARLPILKGLLFPTRPTFTEKKLAGWLRELDEEGCIQLYTVDGAEYLQLTGWEKHRGGGRRASTSKCPKPLPRDPRKSQDILEIQGNPSEKREARDEKREARASEEDTSSESKRVVFPAEGSEEAAALRASLLPWASRSEPGRRRFSAAEVDYAIGTCRDSKQGTNGTCRTMAGWAGYVRNALKADDGWGLRGFDAELAARQSAAATSEQRDMLAEARRYEREQKAARAAGGAR